ncbi:Exocyst complex component 4 [Trichoplax sp. H2]|nr:Exocyst complex component 4 [Trichoplax sp. H2]|eukprot:RDD37262.1 Exocyst complex component 4 [Trichoplax sp. H2]
MSGTKSGATYLIAVIKSLSISGGDKHHRDDEKARLESEFTACDDKLERLIAENYDQLQAALQAFTGIRKHVTDSLETVKQLKSKLIACKELLSYRREDLFKPWMDSVEEKQKIKILDKIDKIRSTPEQFDKYVAEKRYLHATGLLVTTLESLDGQLKSIEGLRELKAELRTRKEKMHETLIEELSNQIYVRSVKDIETNKITEAENDASRKRAKTRTAIRNMILHDRSSEGHAIRGMEDLLQSQPEDDGEYFVNVIVEALNLLGKIPDAIVTIESRIKREIQMIIKKTKAQISDNPRYKAMSAGDAQILLEFLNLLFKKFCAVTKAHEVAADAIDKSLSGSNVTQNENIAVYRVADVWSEMQYAVQNILNQYLDVTNTAASLQIRAQTYKEASINVAEYYTQQGRFLRTGPKPQKKGPLFRFDNSSHAITMSSYLMEKKLQDPIAAMEDYDVDIKLPCTPHANHINAVYKGLCSFIAKAEENLGLKEGNHCPLFLFVDAFISDIYLRKIQLQVKEKIDSVVKGVNALKNMIDMHTQKLLKLARPILHSTVVIHTVIHDLVDMIHDLPRYCPKIVDLLLEVITNYRDVIAEVYNGVLRFASDGETKVISAKWAKDAYISNLLKSLPSWKNIMSAYSEETNVDDESVTTDRNQQESEYLSNNLSSEMLQKEEILSEYDDLRMLGNLHESLVWFSDALLSFCDVLKHSIPKNTSESQKLNQDEGNSVVANSISSLNKLSEDFKEISETCLLVLHLEVRCHCFFYLSRATKISSYECTVDALDPDPLVIGLNKDLARIEDTMSTCLHPNKLRYLFDGLGSLLSIFMISSASYIKKLNSNGIEKMCRNIFALQQNLNNITLSREIALDRCRQYYELLNLSTDDIIQCIIDKGRLYKDTEYINLLTLQSRRTSFSGRRDFKAKIKRLQEVLKEIA